MAIAKRNIRTRWLSFRFLTKQSYTDANKRVRPQNIQRSKAQSKINKHTKIKINKKKKKKKIKKKKL